MEATVEHVLSWSVIGYLTGAYYLFLQDRIAAFQMFAVMYIKYIQIFRKIEECYDQVISREFVTIDWYSGVIINQI